MSDFHFLIPTPTIAVWVVGAFGSVLSASGFGGTTTSVSVVVAASVIVIGGILTLRNNLKTFWKDLAEEREEKIKVLEEHAEIKLEERAQFAEEQREVRHQLKTEMATIRAELVAERAKHDLTSVFARFDGVEAIIASRDDILNRQNTLLEAILIELRRRPDPSP